MTDPRTSSPYRVLSRKYRPLTFNDLMGQDLLVTVLTHALEEKRVPHAFLLTGVRGVGKTTTARIMARALNCIGIDGKGSETPHPCGICEPCRAILEDRHMDVIEMDAASRTGVDDIREVIEASRYRPVSARYKVYIIDEVHMLSKNAFNALLKTLEEPPQHVKFIFATTEIHKVPDTVLSRCIKFNLKRLERDELVRLFKKILEKEQASAQDPALRLIAQKADGSARDGLSLLDQALHLSKEEITEDAVKSMLHVSGKGETLSLLRFLLEGKAKEALQKLSTLYHTGGDPLSLLQDLLDRVHELMVLKISPQGLDDVFEKEDQEIAIPLSEEVSVPLLDRFWQLLVKGRQEVERTQFPLRATEMLFIRLAYISPFPTLADLLDTVPSEDNSEKEDVRPLPKTFTDMVKLFGEHKEPLLQTTLTYECHLIDYAPGVFSLRLKSSVPKDFIPRVRACLNQWTGITWVIQAEEEGGDETLHVQEEEKIEAKKRDAQDIPLVRATLDVFPGAVINTVE